MKFEWDTAKEDANRANHGVDFTEAQGAFLDPKALVLFDVSHSSRSELRWSLLGRVGRGSCWCATHIVPRGSSASLARGTGRKAAIFMKPTGKNIPFKPTFDAGGYQANMKSLNGEPLPDRLKAKVRPFKHGGARRGAGRKQSGNVPILLRLAPDTIGRLKRQAKKQRKGNSILAGEILAAALRP
jgi:uncharacterized DUF497 family protein